MTEDKTNNKVEFPKSRIMNSRQLIDLIKESSENNVRFCFILGSGASISSDIPMGKTLENTWMKCLMGEEDDMGSPKRDKELVRKLAKHLYDEGSIDHDFEEIIQQWETNQDISSKYYFDIYKLRFYPDSQNGDRYLERLMEGKVPSLGYHILSIFMEAYPQNNLIITTNFDSLMEDALHQFASRRPFVVGHESLARYISSDVQRPIIAKVHRSLFCEPFNNTQTTSKLSPEWRDALDYAFKTYVPIVIGYGGGDGSLMSFLEEKETRMRHGIYWCCVGDGCKQEQRIQDLVEQKEGYFIEIKGFDQLMYEIGKALFPKRIDSAELEKRWRAQTEKWVGNYHEQVEPLEKELSITQNNKKINKKGTNADKSNRTYWEYLDDALDARQNQNIKKAIEEFTSAIKNFPDYIPAYLYRGDLYNELRKYDEAEKDIAKAIDLSAKKSQTERKYQILISSIYTELHEERVKVRNAIMAMNHIPVDMDIINTYNDQVSEIIKNTIDASDYYVLIIGHPNRSVISEEQDECLKIVKNEYIYAKKTGIPILAFVHEEAFDFSIKNDDINDAAFYDFLVDVTGNRLVTFWNDPDELTNKVISSLVRQFNRAPRIGWVRGQGSL